MSTGFKNNNAGNINMTSDKWEGMTGNYKITADGQKNVEFQDMVFGLRALMTIIDNKLESGQNLYNLVKSYVGFNKDSDIMNYMKIINEYSNMDFDTRPNGTIPDATYQNVLSIARGIVENEIPEYNQISDSMWQDALNYYSGNNHVYNPKYDFRTTNTNQSIAPSNIGTLFLLGLIALGVIYRKKIFS